MDGWTDGQGDGWLVDGQRDHQDWIEWDGLGWTRQAGRQASKQGDKQGEGMRK